MRIRQGNDFIFLWAIERSGEPEDFSNAVNIKLHFKNFDCVGEVKSFQIVDGNIVRVEVTPEWASRLGAYRLILSYEFEDLSYSDGDQKCVVDVLAFNIVPKTSEADDVSEMAKTTDIMIGFYGLSAYEVWLKDNPESTKEDYYNWLRQPATDAVSLIDDKIEHLDEVIDSSTENESERVSAETLRLQSENLRISAETERKANEVERLANESSRVSDELIREANESSRKQDEATRKTNENERETAELTRQSSESERNEAEGLRIDAEIVREQQEQARQANTATVISEANTATINANDAGDRANAEADRLEGAVSFTVKTRDEYNQITPKISEKIYVTKPTLLIPSAEEKQGFAFKGEDLIYPNYVAKENLIFHYDFSGMKNSDVTKRVARDLSGNGNDGTLMGFGYVAGSGYQDEGLKFDGEGANISTDTYTLKNFTFSFVSKWDSAVFQIITGGVSGVSGGIMHHTTGLWVRFNNEYYASNILLGRDVSLNKTFKLDIVVSQVSEFIFKTEYYINGVFVKSGDKAVSIPFTGISIKDISPVGAIRFNGEINNTLVYNRALTPFEIAQNYAIDKKRFNIIDNNPTPEALAITSLGGTLI